PVAGRSGREPEPAAPATAVAPPPSPSQTSPPHRPGQNSPAAAPVSVTQTLPPTPAGPPMPAQPARQHAGGGGGEDWEAVIGALQGMAEEALGNRSRKVKDILGAAEHSRAGVENAINQIPTISLLFVDSSLLEAPAQEMRTRLETLV